MGDYVMVQRDTMTRVSKADRMNMGPYKLIGKSGENYQVAPAHVGQFFKLQDLNNEVQVFEVHKSRCLPFFVDSRFEVDPKLLAAQDQKLSVVVRILSYANPSKSKS